VAEGRSLSGSVPKRTKGGRDVGHRTLHKVVRWGKFLMKNVGKKFRHAETDGKKLFKGEKGH